MELRKEELYEKSELKNRYDEIIFLQEEERKLRYDLSEARSNLSFVIKHEKMAFGELLTQMFFFIPISLGIGFEIIKLTEGRGIEHAAQSISSAFVLIYLLPIWFEISKGMYGILVKMLDLPSFFQAKTLTFREEILLLNERIKRSQKKLEETIQKLKELNIEKEKKEEAALREKIKREQKMMEGQPENTSLHIVSYSYTEELLFKQKQRYRNLLKFYEMCMEEKEEEKEDILRELKRIRKEFQNSKTQILLFFMGYLILVCAWKVMIRNQEIASVFMMLGMAEAFFFLFYYFLVLDAKITDYLVEQESVLTMGYAFCNNLVPKKYQIIRIETELEWMREKKQTIQKELAEMTG